MTFNKGARLDPSRIQRRGRAAGAGGMAVGGGIMGIVLLLLGAYLGVDLTGFSGASDGSNVVQADPEKQADYEEKCQTGADANEFAECRVGGAINSLDEYWESAAPAIGADFNYPDVIIFDDVTSSACGTASAQSGPFYCPGDESIYIDTSFFNFLVERFDSSDGPLAEIYVVAHEYGHHIQHELGVFAVADRTQTGANSDTVDVELMADCLAGVWAHHASTVADESGTPYLSRLTESDIKDALDAAAAVGDDRIQETIQGHSDPHTYTHGTSEQRQAAFLGGYTHGSPALCDRFGVVER